MAYTSHGHHIPGTAFGVPPDLRASCGGNRICLVCATEAFQSMAEQKNRVESGYIPPKQNEPTDYASKAKDYVKRTVDAYYRDLTGGGIHPDEELPAYDIYVIWFAKTLQNWKAIVSTTLEDGRIYEVTHNGDTSETYVDRYIKEHNTLYVD